MELIRKVYGEQKAKLLLTVAEHFTFDFDPVQKEFLRALNLISDARRAAEAAHSEPWLDQCRILMGKYEFKQGNLQKGKAALMEIVSAAHLSKNYAREADAWSSLGNIMPQDDSTFLEIIHDHEQAVKYHLMAGHKKDAAYSLRDLATVNGNYNRADSAEHQLLRTVAILKSINEKISITTYTILADFYRMNGKYDKALFYAFEALKVRGDVEEKKMYTYSVMAQVYNLLKSYPEALKYYKILFTYAKERNLPNQYIFANDVATAESDGGNPRKALSFLSGFIKDRPLPLLNFKQITARTFGDIYNKMGNYNKAERYYLEMLSYNSAVKAENLKNLNSTATTLAGGASYYIIGKFYIERKNYAKAKNFLILSQADPQYVNTDQVMDTNHLLFKADSALNNYILAIQHFTKFHALNDSVNSVAKNKQISELNIKYQTAQRLKDIRELQNSQLIQQARLEHSVVIRNVILGGAAVLLMLALLAYNGYRNKQKANYKITAQREEIRSQNLVLQDLLAEKDNFLKEKDWLLKEIHHRVKNNLQIVMSLLSTQSSYLQNDDAIEAILESENRVQSIALIHQKLYSSENLASINMPDYVADLTLQLSQAFDLSGRKIRIRQIVDDIFLDLSQAVPIGLILNEAITNAIKHAFDASGGEISITFKRITPVSVLLLVADNGKGLPEGFNVSSANSLGMEMMQGLSRQLRGTFHITTFPGTAVQVEFNLEPSLMKTLKAL